MTAQAYSMFAIYVAAGLTCIGILIVFGARRPRNWSSFGLLMAGAIWVMGMIGTWLPLPPVLRYTSLFIQYGASLCLPPFLIATVLGILRGPVPGSKVLIIGVWIISALLYILILTSGATHLVTYDFRISADGISVERTRGPLSGLYSWYLLAATGASIVVLLIRSVRASQSEGRRSIILAVAFIIPAITGFLEMIGVRPDNGLSLLPAAIGASAIVLTYGIMSARLLSPISRAHEEFMKAMDDPVVVLDTNGTVEWVNPAAQLMIPTVANGVSIHKLMPDLHAQVLAHADQVSRVFEFNEIDYLVQVRAVAQTKGHVTLLVFRDVTTITSARVQLELLVNERTAQLEIEIIRYRQSRDELQRLVADKTMLLQELHHRVKNNLQIIMSLIDLQARRLGADNPSLPAFRAMKNRIASISLVHDQLHRNHLPQGVDLGEYINRLVRSIVTSYSTGRFNLTIDIPTEKLLASIGFCVDLGLVINELVSNSFKHVLIPAGGGSLSLAFVPEADGVRFELRDGGPGIVSTDPVAQGLGFSIVQLICQKHQMTLRYQKDPAGTYELLIPFKDEQFSLVV